MGDFGSITLNRPSFVDEREETRVLVTAQNVAIVMVYWYCKTTYNLGHSFPKATYNLEWKE